MFCHFNIKQLTPYLEPIRFTINHMNIRSSVQSSSTVMGFKFLPGISPLTRAHTYHCWSELVPLLNLLNATLVWAYQLDFCLWYINHTVLDWGGGAPSFIPEVLHILTALIHLILRRFWSNSLSSVQGHDTDFYTAVIYETTMKPNCKSCLKN